MSEVSDNCDAETKVDSANRTQIQEMLKKIPRICHQKTNQTPESELFDLQSAQKLFDLLQKKNIGDDKMDLILARAISVHLAVNNGSSNIMMDKMLKIQFKKMELEVSFEEYCRSYYKAKRIIDEEKSTDALLPSQLMAMIEGVSQTEPREKNKKKSGIHVSSGQMFTYLLNRDSESEREKKARRREIKKSEKETLKDLCW